MTNVNVIQPSELGSDFVFDAQTKKWSIKPNVSADVNNAIQDINGAFLDISTLKRYRIIQDNAARKIRLYEHAVNQDFSQALLIDEVDMISLDAQVDDVAISNGILIFTDTQTGSQLLFDTNSPIYSVLKANSNSITISGDGKTSELMMDLIVDPSTDNLLKVTAAGAMLDKNDILALLNSAGVGAVTFTAAHEPASNLLRLNVSGVEQTIATTRLLNSSGEVLGYLISE